MMRQSARTSALTVVLAASFVAAGCAVANDSRRAHLARQDLVGVPRAEIESCAGSPLRVEYGGNYQYLTYVSPPPSAEAAAVDESRACVATFMVRNGYIEDLAYATPSGGIIGKNIRECLAIVGPCLPKAPED